MKRRSALAVIASSLTAGCSGVNPFDNRDDRTDPDDQLGDEEDQSHDNDNEQSVVNNSLSERLPNPEAFENRYQVVLHEEADSNYPEITRIYRTEGSIQELPEIVSLTIGSYDSVDSAEARVQEVLEEVRLSYEVTERNIHLTSEIEATEQQAQIQDDFFTVLTAQDSTFYAFVTAEDDSRYDPDILADLATVVFS